MKIGIIVDNEFISDVRVLRETRILKENGHEIFVLCFAFARHYADPPEGISITRIRIGKKLKDILFFMLNSIPVYEWLWAFRIGKFIRKNNLEILHVHDLYMSHAAHSGINKSGKSIPLILDLHENYPFTILTYNWTKGFLRNLIARPGKWQIKEKQYLQYADRIIVLSSDFRDLLLSRYPFLDETRFTVLPNVPELEDRVNKVSIDTGKLFDNDYPVLFYYGVIAERRGIFDALEVFSELAKAKYSANFLLIGPVDKKDRERFLKMTDSPLIRNHVRHIPWINAAELPSWLEKVDICLAPFHRNPQHESGVANKIYEYMQGGKPLIVSDCKPQKALIERHNCGIVFSDNLEFFRAAACLLENEELRKEMGMNGIAAIRNHYNTQKVKNELLDLYNTVKK